MSDVSPLLPAGFEALEEHVAWSLETEAERNGKRLQTPYPEIKKFYDAMLERSEEIVRLLDRTPVAGLSPHERRLYFMMMSLMEVATAVEFFQAADLADAVPADRVTIMSPAYR